MVTLVAIKDIAPQTQLPPVFQAVLTASGRVLGATRLTIAVFVNWAQLPAPAMV